MAKVNDDVFNPKDIPSSSYRQSESTKPKEQRVKAVTTATSRKKSVGRKMADLFISEDIDSVKSYLVYDVIIPAIKGMIVDSITKGVGRLFYSDVRPSSSSRSGGHTSYDSYYNNSGSKYRSSDANDRNRDRLDISNHLIPTRGEAEKVIDGLIEAAERYDGEASLAIYYELVGIPDEYTDRDWAWKLQTLKNARINRVANGYIIDLPKPQPVEK